MDSPADVATHPVVVYTTVIAVAGYVLATAIAKVVGPLAEAMESAAERRRQYRQRAEDARILDLSSQVDHLAGRVWTLEQSADRQATYLTLHAAWDHEVTMAALAAGVEVPPAPPLRPPPTTTDMRGS